MRTIRDETRPRPTSEAPNAAHARPMPLPMCAHRQVAPARGKAVLALVSTWMAQEKHGQRWPGPNDSTSPALARFPAVWPCLVTGARRLEPLYPHTLFRTPVQGMSGSGYWVFLGVKSGAQSYTYIPCLCRVHRLYLRRTANTNPNPVCMDTHKNCPPFIHATVLYNTHFMHGVWTLCVWTHTLN